MRVLVTLSTLMAGITPLAAQEISGSGDAASALKTQFTVSAGTDYAQGSVGDASNYETLSGNVGLLVTNGRFSAAVSLPYVSTSAPEGVVVSQGGLFGTPLLGTPATQTKDVRREGVGDLTAQAGYSFPLSAVDASVTAAVKFPTASREKGLGTGKMDYGVSTQISKQLGKVIPFVGAGYRIIGEPSHFDVRNTAAASAGARILLGGTSSLTAAYSYDQSASRAIGDNQSINLAAGTNLSSRVRIGVDGAAGLSSDAPELKVGLRIGIGL